MQGADFLFHKLCAIFGDYSICRQYRRWSARYDSLRSNQHGARETDERVATDGGDPSLDSQQFCADLRGHSAAADGGVHRVHSVQRYPHIIPICPRDIHWIEIASCIVRQQIPVRAAAHVPW